MLLCPWDSPGKNTGVGCHALLQGIFLIQESNPCLFCLLHWQSNSLPLTLSGKPGSPYSCFLILSILDHCKQKNELSELWGPSLILFISIILAILFFQFKDTSSIIVSNLKGIWLILRRNGMKMKILITRSELRAEILYL